MSKFNNKRKHGDKASRSSSPYKQVYSEAEDSEYEDSYTARTNGKEVQLGVRMSKSNNNKRKHADKASRSSSPLTQVYKEAEDLEYEDPYTAEFFEHRDAKPIGHGFIARMQFNDYENCHYIYLARRYAKDKLSIIKWSVMECHQLVENLTALFDSYNKHPTSGPESKEIIDFFNGKDVRRLYEHENKDYCKYFEKPDFSFENVQVRFAHKKSTNMYSMYMHSRVREDRRMQNWDGPTLILNLNGMYDLFNFIKKAERRADLELTKHSKHFKIEIEDSD